MVRRWRLLPVIVVCILPMGGLAQAPPQAAITGLVVDGATGEAVPGAIVQLVAQPVLPRATPARLITDDKGRFAFLDLAPGAYTIVTTKSGYLDGGYGRDRAPTDRLREVSITGQVWVPNVRVAIWKPGSIAGIVRDEAGEAVVGVYVRAIRRFRIQGRDEVAAGPVTVTDDRGEYRIGGLAPGRYVIQVPSVQASMPAGTVHRSNPFNDIDVALDVDDTSRLLIARFPLPPPTTGGARMSYPPAFHPSGSSVVHATPIDLGYGDERAAIDVTLSPVPNARVSGMVDAPAEALPFLTLRLLPAGLEQLGQGAEVATTLVSADGSFTFINVPAGSYTIDAPLRITEFISPSPGTRMYFPVPPGRSGWNREVDPIDATAGIQYMSTDFRAGEGANYSGRGSVTVGGADVTGVVIRLTPNATMSGRVVPEPDPRQPNVKPPTRFLVSLDPTDGAVANGVPRPRTGPRADGQPGEFSIPGIAPGQYWLRVLGSPGWLVKSAVWKGRDYVNEPFDARTSDDFSDMVITVTNAVPRLSGAVRSSTDVKAEDALVVVFPTDPADWRAFGLWPARMKTATVSTAGTYSLTTLPAGDYFVAAIDRTLGTAWMDPVLLERLARTAPRVTLTWGAATSQDVTTVVVR